MIVKVRKITVLNKYQKKEKTAFFLILNFLQPKSQSQPQSKFQPFFLPLENE